MFRSLNIILFFFVLLSGTIVSRAQIQLYNEDFESGGFSFSLNAPGAGGGPLGSNRWIVNNKYTGAPVYPNNLPEDSTYGGTISFAPHSNYLHIYDTVVGKTSGIYNDNFDPSRPSDNFAYTPGICTKSFSNVAFSFFYLCEGSATAYGEVYYSINYGPWIKTGSAQYNNKYKWKYEVITNPAFDNVQTLRFGFRWVNNNAGGAGTQSFGVDDIKIIGDYNGSITSTVISVQPNPVCQGSLLFVGLKLSDTLCDGTYQIQISGPGGTFPPSPQGLGVFPLYSPRTTDTIPVILPTTTAVNGCYKVRLDRLAPPPAIVGVASACFSVIACPNTITTLQPAVTKDTNAVCIGSVIDVPFYSTGLFNSNNKYTAQLSDASGVFSATPTVLGSSFDPATYDPGIGSLPGSVGGLIPVVPPGCKYYVRIVSTNPATTGSVWGPFCIGKCDITTNNKKDIRLCMSSCKKNPNGADTAVTYIIHTNNTGATYAPGNSFTVQLLDSKFFQKININPPIGVKYDVTSSTIKIHMPCPDTLLKKGIKPGLIYLRVVASNSSYPDSSLGTLIHLTFGAPADSVKILGYDTAYCTGDVGNFYISPYSYDSKYDWQSPGLSGGTPFSWAYDPLSVNFTGYAGPLTLKVRENSSGCYGPWSPVIKVNVNGPPSVNITSPPTICTGDTIRFDVPFANSTSYKWTINKSATVIDTANNEISVKFDTTGVFNVKITAVNKCGSASKSKIVNVKASPKVNAGLDTTICPNNTVTLKTTKGNYTYQWKEGKNVVGSADSVVVHPTKSTTYTVTVTASGGCSKKDSVSVKVVPLPVVNAGLDTNICSPGSVKLKTNSGPYTYTWSDGKNIVGTADSIKVNPAFTTTYIVTATDTAGGCASKDTVVVIVNSTPLAEAGKDTTVCANSTLMLSTTPGLNTYSWKDGTTVVGTSANATVIPVKTATYILSVTGKGGCPNSDTVTVFVNPAPTVSVSKDTTIEKGNSVQLSATGASNYTWTPSSGLSCNDCPNPVATPVQTTTYDVITIGSNGCPAIDSVTVFVIEIKLPCGDLFIPTAFSPNDDGVNDYMQPRGVSCLKSFVFNIYDRWGEKVFETTTTENKWDGIYRGKKLNSGVYIYYFTAITTSGATIARQGNITLVR